MHRTPLEDWIARTIVGLHDRGLSPELIRDYQCEKLRNVIDYVREKSPFYRNELRGLSGKDIQAPDDLSALPMTTAVDLQNQGPQFLCVSQSEVERIVTLQLPGSTEPPKRIFFSPHDLERTIDFFHHGMTTMVQPGQLVLILMPGDRPASVGDLLATALQRAGIEGIVHGVVLDPVTTIREITDKQIDCLVGIPTQVLALARHERGNEIPAGLIKSVLLSADYVPASLVREVAATWQCKVFSHYGSTEMGFGGGVECEAFAGYHVREADLFIEIVDPVSGNPVPDGQPGEIVFTTLSRTAMPLVRYRTGDLSRFLAEPCPCGTVLKRLEKVRGKVTEMVRLRSGDWLGMPDLDEVLFSLPGIVNYMAELIKGEDTDRLAVTIYAGSCDTRAKPEEILRALTYVPPLGHAVETAQLALDPIRFSAKNWISTGVTKRAIVQRRDKE